MRQRGRKSAGELAIAAPVQVQRRPGVPVELTPEQADVWQSVVDALPADWFPAETHSLLMQFCRHTVDARRIAQLIDQESARPDIEVSAYLELLKAQRAETASLKAMASAMRLSQQSSRRDDNSATAKKNRTTKRPWEG